MKYLNFKSLNIFIFIKFFFIIAFSLSITNRLIACTMVPSVWKTINSVTDDKQPPTVYALTEVFMELVYKLDREMRASKIPVKPFVIRSIINEKDNNKVSKEIYDLIKEASEMVLKSSEILAYEKLLVNGDEKLDYDFTNKYKVDLIISDYKTTNIEMIDINPQVWALLQFVKRDEAKVIVRISDGKDDSPLFLDEFEVSPTIIIQPLLSPVGGYIIKVEKNNFKSIVVDWGTVGDGTEHILRINTQYYPPYKTPPLNLFKSDSTDEINNDQDNAEICNQLVFAIQNGDFDLFKVVLETYPNFDVNSKTSEGKSPIHYVSSIGSVEMLKALLEKKANINQLTYENDTALHEAIKSGKTTEGFIKLLIDNGADINIKNKDEKTPIELAKQLNTNLLDVLISLTNK